jgi:Protein of unknown function (DUF3300)
MIEKLTRYFRPALAGICLLTLGLIPSAGFSQITPVPVPTDTGQPIPVLTGNELDGLVAPIALYPDPLISQILVASTYPLEVVEAYQWLQRNPGLSSPALTQAAAAQNWDPSIQALVVFPDVLRRLNEDISWTTNLGNAFLNQQASVMAAIQRMRLSAEQSGRLVSTPQQQVITTAEAGQPVVEILPANPEVIYVPVYDPAWFWGPAVYYPYPRWYYPRMRSGIFFSVGIPIGGFFGGNWHGWGGWGWHPAWGSRTVVINNTFIERNNFNSLRTRNVTNMPRTSVWSHDAFHRQGVPYPNQVLNQRFGGNVQRNMMPSRAATPIQGPERAFGPASRPAQMAEAPSVPPSQAYAGRPMPAPRMENRPMVSSAPARNWGSFRSERSYSAPPVAKYSAPMARPSAPMARPSAPMARPSAPMARSFAPAPRSRGFSSRDGRSGKHGRAQQ